MTAISLQRSSARRGLARRPRRARARRPGRLRPLPVPSMPGLDGLRALSVSAVFAYHAEMSWLPGGFLGVDVFFVISGYLITALLVSEWTRTGRISLAGFWRRRARRLLPALLLVIAATLVAGALVSPGQVGALRESALSALLYVANWHDALSHASYFSRFGRPPLLRHLWSLSVEEQFYLLWPPLVVLAVGRRRVGWLAALLALASGVEMALLASGHPPTRLYEGTDTRAGTLLVGALAAVIVHPGRMGRLRRRVPPVVLDLVGVAGAAGLVVMMVAVRGESVALFSGQLQLAGLLAAGLVLAAAQPGGVIAWLLSRRPLVWVGRRSYGIYLWHWPVIALTRSPNAGYGQSWELTCLQIALTLALAAASYALVEQPIRRLGFRATLTAAGRHLAGVPRGWRGLASGIGVVMVAVVAVGGCAVALGIGALGRPRTANDQRVPQASGALTGRSLPHQPPLEARAGQRRRVGPHLAVSGPTMVFGDSVVLGAAGAIAARLGPGTRFNAVVGRQPQDTIAAVAAARAAGELPRRVVISLGDNGLVTTAMLRDLRRAVADVPDVVLLTPRVPDSWGPPSAAAIRDSVRWWPRVRIADWARLSADRDDWFTDGVHPDDVGIRKLVSLVVSQLSRR